MSDNIIVDAKVTEVTEAQVKGVLRLGDEEPEVIIIGARSRLLALTVGQVIEVSISPYDVTRGRLVTR